MFLVRFSLFSFRWLVWCGPIRLEASIASLYRLTALVNRLKWQQKARAKEPEIGARLVEGQTLSSPLFQTVKKVSTFSPRKKKVDFRIEWRGK